MDYFPSQQNYLIISTILLGIILAFYFFFRSKNRVTAVPQAGGAWPIIGHFTLVSGGSQLPHIALSAMADKYGPIFTVRLGIQRLMIISSWEIVKEIFTTYDLIISDRPKFLAAENLSYNYAMFGLAPYGPFWRDMRKLISLELLSSHRLELLKHVRVSEIEASVKEIYNLWDENKKRTGNMKVLVEMKNWLGDLNLNVVLRMIVGKKYFGATNNKDETEAIRCRKVLREFFSFLGLTVVGDALPFLRWFDFGGHEKAMKETAKEMDSIVERWLEEHKQKKDSGKVTGEQDFMDVMLSTVEKEGFHGIDADTIIKSTCMVLIASSSDTLTIALTWTLSLLLNNIHVLKRAQEELDLHIGRDRQVNESDINKLVYLQAIVKEMFRLHPPGAFAGPREFTEDCIISGYHVKKGTRLVTNLWKLHRDPKIWENPSEFIPERFLSTHKDVDVKGKHFELIPFGAGRRFCPGINMALQMLHLVLATLLHSFDMSTPGNELVDMTRSAGMTNEKATPLEVLLSPRLSLNVNN